jgi:8-oxo-dGTP pyrophosphatase MutT (NUDIX family)
MFLVLNKAVIHFSQRYEHPQLRVLLTRRERKRDPDLETRIGEVWTRATAQAEPGALWDGELARLIAYGALPDRLALFVGRTTYREFLGTNLESADLHETLGEDHYANPLGVSAAVMTRDEAVLLGRRSHRVAEARGLLDLPGGNVPFSAGQIDPFRSMRAELHEELGIEEQDIDELTCIGLVENGFTHKPDLVFLCRVGERARGLVKRLRARPGVEHEDFLCVPGSKSEILEFLRVRGDDLTPVAAGGLALFVS